MIDFRFATPLEWDGLLARISLLEQSMATIQEALANAQVQVTELTAAVAATATFIDDIKGQIASLQALIASIGDPAEIAASVDALATTVDAAEQSLLAKITNPTPPPPPAT